MYFTQIMKKQTILQSKRHLEKCRFNPMSQLKSFKGKFQENEFIIVLPICYSQIPTMKFE